MFRRVWTPTAYDISVSTTESKIVFYDSGVYCGEMVENEFVSWEIHSRVRNDNGEIVEELREMPPDWAPFDSAVSETYSGIIRRQGAELQIRGWIVRTEPVNQQVNQQVNHISAHSLQGAQGRGRGRGQSPQGQASHVQGVKPISSNQTEYNSRGMTGSKSQGLIQNSYRNSPHSDVKQGQKPLLPEQEQAQAQTQNSSISRNTVLQGEREQQRPRRQQRSQQVPGQIDSFVTSRAKILQLPQGPREQEQKQKQKPAHQNQLIQAEERAPSQQASLKTKRSLKSVNQKEKKYINIPTPRQTWTPLVQAGSVIR